MVSPSPIVNFIIRGFQVVFAAIVLGLSVGLVREQRDDVPSPISLRYCSFVGAITLVAGFVGIAAEWVSVLQGKIGLIIDAVVTCINLSGGVLLAVLIGNPKCSDTSDVNREKLFDNDLFSQGCTGKGVNRSCQFDDLGTFNDRCKKCQADTVFMFFLAILLLASSTMTFLRMKKGY